MNKKSKTIIQEALKAELKNEGFFDQYVADPIRGAVQGIANVPRGMMGQVRLGQVNSKLKQTSKRMQKDWEKTKEYGTAKAEKMQSSKNQQVARYGQQIEKNLQNVDMSLSQAFQKLSSIADSGADSGGPSSLERERQMRSLDRPNENADVGVAKWLRLLGMDSNNISNTQNGNMLKTYQAYLEKGIDLAEIDPKISYPILIPLMRLNRNLSDKEVELVVDNSEKVLKKGGNKFKAGATPDEINTHAAGQAGPPVGNVGKQPSQSSPSSNRLGKTPAQRKLRQRPPLRPSPSRPQAAPSQPPEMQQQQSTASLPNKSRIPAPQFSDKLKGLDNIAKKGLVRGGLDAISNIDKIATRTHKKKAEAVPVPPAVKPDINLDNLRQRKQQQAMELPPADPNDVEDITAEMPPEQEIKNDSIDQGEPIDLVQKKTKGLSQDEANLINQKGLPPPASLSQKRGMENEKSVGTDSPYSLQDLFGTNSSKKQSAAPKKKIALPPEPKKPRAIPGLNLGKISNDVEADARKRFSEELPPAAPPSNPNEVQIGSAPTPENPAGEPAMAPTKDKIGTKRSESSKKSSDGDKKKRPSARRKTKNENKMIPSLMEMFDLK